jgi:hypothetical protein
MMEKRASSSRECILEDGRIIINSSEEDLSIFLRDLELEYEIEIEYRGRCG